MATENAVIVIAQADGHVEVARQLKHLALEEMPDRVDVSAAVAVAWVEAIDRRWAGGRS